MLAVVCTLVIVLGNGARDVRHFVPGFEVLEAKEADGSYKRMTGDYLLVDFSQVHDLPEPKVRVVRANDCKYVSEDPAKEYGNYLKHRELQQEQSTQDQKRWKEFHKKK